MALFEKWNPSRELERFRREFDDFLEKFGLEGGVFKDWHPSIRPAMESCVEGDELGGQPVNLPGYKSSQYRCEGLRWDAHRKRCAGYRRRQREAGLFPTGDSLWHLRAFNLFAR